MADFNFYFKTAGLHKLGNTRAYDAEFSTEMYDKTFNTSNMPPFNAYTANGIETARTHDKLTLIYKGELAKKGGRDIYAVVNYGDDTHWESASFYPMQSIGNQAFEVLLPINSSKSIHVAFKDSANNWDNNKGTNYTFNSSFYTGGH